MALKSVEPMLSKVTISKNSDFFRFFILIKRNDFEKVLTVSGSLAPATAKIIVSQGFFRMANQVSTAESAEIWIKCVGTAVKTFCLNQFTDFWCSISSALPNLDDLVLVAKETFSQTIAEGNDIEFTQKIAIFGYGHFAEGFLSIGSGDFNAILHEQG